MPSVQLVLVQFSYIQELSEGEPVLPGCSGCGVRLLNSAQLPVVCKSLHGSLPNIKHADGGRGDARRLNKEWTNVIGAGL